MPAESPIAEQIPENKKGSLGLELDLNGKWVDVTLSNEPSTNDSGVGQSYPLDSNFDGDSSTEASLGHNAEHFSGNSETGDSEPSRTNEDNGNYNNSNWWMTSGTNNQTYFNMQNMNATDGLISLTPVQLADGLQPLTALAPLQYSPDQQHSNGYDNLLSVENIKQEVEDHPEDGESQEAKLFQGISVKQEIFIHQSDTVVDIPIHRSPYFEQQNELETQNPLDIKFVTRDHEVLNGHNGWNVQDSTEEENEESVLEKSVVEAADTPKPSKTKSKNAKTSTSTVPEVEGDGAPPPPATPEKQRKKPDRFNGIPLSEVAKKLLPDHLAPNLDILIIGINPGLYAAHVGHHYAGPGNHFWKCMFMSGMISEPYCAYDDFRMIEYGIGFTNVVARTTRSSTDLSKKEMKEGSEILKEKIRLYKPLIAVFNGKTIYEIFSGKKNFCFGRQPEKVEGTDTHIWVMPSSSARCAQLPRAVDKVPFYAALRKFLDYLKGRIQELDEAEVVFSSVILKNVKKTIKTEPDTEEMHTAKGNQTPPKRKSEETSKATKKK
ncbi:hypothetical protein SK128_023560 [Halocaridina rubra]|uniref:G/T mismatch-specific thymine DNA glycosylase n=1 Tax=Halocaridina rubra TaxID=373956 RepID=A0AAN8X1A9_HALRR